MVQFQRISLKSACFRNLLLPFLRLDAFILAKRLFFVDTNLSHKGSQRFIMIESGCENSSLALERLRVMLRDIPATGDTRLPTERQLAESLGIGRRSVRRALEVLEAEGLVWRRQGAGTFAGPRPETLEAGGELEANFSEVMEVRLRLEPQLAQLAALRASGQDILRMRDILVRLEAAEDADGRELWDSALHREIARAAGNRFFLMIFDSMDRARHEDTWRALRERARNSANLAQTMRQHRDIVDAIAAHDPVRAGAAMRGHLMAVHDGILRLTSLEALDDAS
jgi:DNA-binding FadR family transcriptional regulator